MNNYNCIAHVILEIKMIFVDIQNQNEGKYFYNFYEDVIKQFYFFLNNNGMSMSTFFHNVYKNQDRLP